MEISAEKIEDVKDPYYFHHSYTVHIESHRILTIVTYCDVTAARWLKDAEKANNVSSLPNTLVVGFSVERRYDEFTRHGLLDTPYDLLCLCIGSHCLIYLLDDPATAYRRNYRPSKFFNPFFNSPKVIVVGMEIKEKAARLNRDFGVKIKNAVDLNELAVKRMRRDDLDLGRYDLDRLVKAVLGKRMDVVRPVKKLEWFKETYPYCSRVDEMNEMKVLFTTTDVYLCYRIGSHLFSMIHGNDSSAAASSKKKGRRKKKKLLSGELIFVGLYFLRRPFAAPYKKKKRNNNKNGKRELRYHIMDYHFYW